MYYFAPPPKFVLVIDETRKFRSSSTKQSLSEMFARSENRYLRTYWEVSIILSTKIIRLS